MATTARYTVTGMTCAHCVSAVTAELTALAGVESVDVALVSGGDSTVTVTSATRLDEAAVRAAVDEAGYELTGARS
ncbi:cation transporter [Micromonospora sp. NPDC049679]|uniref:heavy-metal-associated domain-containing protein n=1 Tax=Micromonospora sp. NPDC049679 TaxID=3155920 RepID=UPI0033FFA7DC